jgi:hypothetical protein
MRAGADSRYFATTGKGDVVSIWDGQTLKLIGEIGDFPADIGSSGGRLALDSKKRVVYSGMWDDGLYCHDYDRGTLLWHRPEYLGIQRVDISAALPDSVFVSLRAPERLWHKPGTYKGIFELDAATGAAVYRFEKGWNLFTHPNSPLFVVEEYADCLHFLDATKEWIGTTSKPHFALIGVAFDETRIAISEGQEGLRVLDHLGQELASFESKTREGNCLEIAFDSSAGTLACRDNWADNYMVIVDPDSGSLIREYRLPIADICFINRGEHFVNWSGMVFRTGDGAEIGQLSR